MKKPHTTSRPNQTPTPAAHWPTPPTATRWQPKHYPNDAGRCGFRRLWLLRLRNRHANNRRRCQRRRALQWLSHNSHVLHHSRALLTGRNHHAVGVGCLANFDSGYPGYRGKISAAAPTLAETLRGVGYRNYMVGKWHVTPLTETGPTGPFDGWPLGRGFDRFYGFLDAETDQYSPELVRDNSHITAPGNYESGYHLTEDLFDQAIGYVKGHIAVSPQIPWFMMVTPGACHAPHQAPKDLIDKYDKIFAKGWDATRADRLARQIEQGIVPEGTVLPPRNDSVSAWDEHSDDERRVFSRLAGAYGAMLEHTDQQLGRLMAFLEQADLLDNTTGTAAVG